MSKLYRFIYLSFKIIFKILYRFEVMNANNVPENGAVILAGNHVSYLDPILISISTKRQVHFLAKSELFKIPVLGFILRNIQIISVDRSKGDIDAIKSSMKVLKEGKVLGIFPQGTRTKDVENISRGIGMISQKTNAPIIPIYIKNSDKAYTKSIFPLRFPKISVIIGDVIYPFTEIKNKEEQSKISKYVIEKIFEMA